MAVAEDTLPDDAGTRALVRLALAEDVGTGDLTTLHTVPEATRARALVVAREELVVAGLGLFETLVEELAAAGQPIGAERPLRLDSRADGERVAAGTVLCRIEGRAWELLTLERSYLNFLGHLSGIATETARVVEAVRAVGSATRILDTRKTTPGWRLLEKYAVVCGGGANHRLGLFDAVLIKDNHVVAAGSITSAVRSALAGAPAGVEVECECDTMEQVREALAAGATAVLLDNFSPDQVRDAVAEIAGRARVECSGGIHLANVAAYAAAGPDDISLGSLTHSARCVDVAMDVELLS